MKIKNRIHCWMWVNCINVNWYWQINKPRIIASSCFVWIRLEEENTRIIVTNFKNDANKIDWIEIIYWCRKWNLKGVLELYKSYEQKRI